MYPLGPLCPGVLIVHSSEIYTKKQLVDEEQETVIWSGLLCVIIVTKCTKM